MGKTTFADPEIETRSQGHESSTDFIITKATSTITLGTDIGSGNVSIGGRAFFTVTEDNPGGGRSTREIWVTLQGDPENVEQCQSGSLEYNLLGKYSSLSFSAGKNAEITNTRFDGSISYPLFRAVYRFGAINGKVSSSTISSEECGETITCVATPTIGCADFKGWKGPDGNILEQPETLTLTSGADDEGEYIAVYEEGSSCSSSETSESSDPGKHTVTVEVNPCCRAGKVTGDGEYEHGTTCTVTAACFCSAWDFKFWKINPPGTKTEMNPYSFKVEQDTTCTAYYSHGNTGKIYADGVKIVRDSSSNKIFIDSNNVDPS